MIVVVTAAAVKGLSLFFQAMSCGGGGGGGGGRPMTILVDVTC
jgi:hypothetical protein